MKWRFCDSGEDVDMSRVIQIMTLPPGSAPCDGGVGEVAESSAAAMARVSREMVPRRVAWALVAIPLEGAMSRGWRRIKLSGGRPPKQRG